MSVNPKEIVSSFCAEQNIPLVGYAAAGRWKEPLFEPWVPPEFSPDYILPETETVIVIGLPVALFALETSPSIWYHELYKTINSLLDQYTVRLASILTQAGFPSVFVPRDGYGSIEVLIHNPVVFFSHRHAAVLAGLGRFGVNNMVLTREFGPRVRFGSIFTTARIPSGPLIEDELCIHCNRCVSLCPASALEEGEYPGALTDKAACTAQSAALNKRHISPCGICIKVCPVGEDRRVFHREDAGIYEPGSDSDLQKGWEHVRMYGGR
nr:4Fe-4S binding protein [uncultured Methanospirillum sp.]